MKNLPVFLTLYILLFIEHVCGEKTVQGLNITQTIAASVNPEGLLLTSQLFYRFPLSSKSGVLWESTKLDAGINNDLSPAFENPGLFIRCEPVAFFELTFNANNILLFKGLGSGYVALDSSSSAHETSDIKNIAQRNESGWSLRCTPVFKAAYKKGILANATTVNYFQMNRNGYYLERFTNTVLDNKDFVISNDLFVFFKHNNSLMTGINYFYLTVPRSNERTHRISLVAVYIKKVSPAAKLNVALVGGTYLKHISYDYKDPYVGLQFQVSYMFRRHN